VTPDLFGKNPKVCAVMCTYGRFQVIRDSITMFLVQDYKNKHLVIFNTADTPLVPDEFLRNHSDITIINQSRQENGDPFSCLGDVRNAALKHAEGDIYICWDDDDLFLPWHISQGVEHLLKCGKVAWKPDVSYWSIDGGKTFKGMMGNSMEASFLVGMAHIKSLGFSTKRSGAEHVDGGWLDKTDFIAESISPFESYGYVWGDERAPHKTSGHIGEEENFENHKKGSQDFGEGPLSMAPLTIMDNFFQAILDVWHNQREKEMNNHTASKRKIGILTGMMRNFYERLMVPTPAFVEPIEKVVEEEEIPKDSVYYREAGWTPPHGSCEGWVQSMCNSKRNGFFVEFGAVDGLSQSNTYRLEHDLGWKGILIEGHKESYTHLVRNRPNVITVNSIISAHDQKEVKWLECHGMATPGGNFDHSRILMPGQESPVGTNVSVTTEVSRSLKSILDEHRAPRHIDYLLVDVETSDLEDLVLNIPVYDYTFDYICIEFPATLDPSRPFAFLTDAGYVMTRVSAPGPDFCFVRAELLK